jgi:hypothetical protein
MVWRGKDHRQKHSVLLEILMFSKWEPQPTRGPQKLY